MAKPKDILKINKRFNFEHRYRLEQRPLSTYHNIDLEFKKFFNNLI